MKLRSHTWVLTVVLWVGIRIPVDSATPANPKVIHVLNRLSLGIRPGDIQKVESMGGTVRGDIHGNGHGLAAN
jgi:hypothetical protein